MTEDHKKQLNKKFGGIFLLFNVAYFFIFMIFPDELVGNIYVIALYLVLAVTFLFYYFSYKKKLESREK